MSLLNNRFTTEEAYRILLDDIDRIEEDFEELNIITTDKDNAIGSDMEEDQLEDQISDHGNEDDQGKSLGITFIIYMHEVILVVTLFYLLFRTQQLIDRRSYQLRWHGTEISELGNCKSYSTKYSSSARRYEAIYLSKR